jgi:penicillin-binding protein 2
MVYRSILIVLSMLVFLSVVHSQATTEFVGDNDYEEICKTALGGANGAILIADVQKCELVAAYGERAIIGGRKQYYPGSVFKIVSALAALKSGFSPGREYRCNDRFACDDGYLRCSLVGGHGKVDMHKALEVSCSYYFYSLAKSGLKYDAVRQVARSLGFDTSPLREVPPANWTNLFGAKERFAFFVGLNGVEVSPYHVLQLVYCVATGTLPDFKRKRAYKISDIADADLNIVREGMKRSVKFGIARNAGVDFVELCAKTGTAIDPNKRSATVGWLAGYFPSREPEFVVTILVENGTGFNEASAIAKKVLIMMKERRKI